MGFNIRNHNNSSFRPTQPSALVLGYDCFSYIKSESQGLTP